MRADPSIGFAERFASDWIAAWNSHDLDRILGHYEDDFEMSSPPDLHFELLTTLAGVDSVTLYYKGHRGLSAEVLHFGSTGKVRAAFAHYELGSL